MKRLWLALLVLLAAPAWAVDLCSVVSVGAGVSNANTATLNFSLPATVNPGDLLVTHSVTFTASTAVTTPPSGYTLLRADTGGASNVVYAKVAGTGEVAPSITYAASGPNAGYMFVLHNPAGWPNTPAVGDVANNSSAARTDFEYHSLSVTVNGGCALQFGKKLTSTAGGSATALATTSGYVSVGNAFLNNGASSIIIGGQLFDGDATAPDLATNDVAVTGNTTSALTRGTQLDIGSGDNVATNPAFVDKTAQALSSTISSANVTLAGFDNWVPIHVAASSDAGCKYSLNGGGYTAADGYAQVGMTLSAQVTSAATGLTAKNCTIDLQGATTVSDTFTATTDDFTPSGFTFVDATNQAVNTLITSAAVTVAGLGTTPAAVTAAGDSGCAASINGGAFSASPGTVVNTDTVRAQVTSSTLNNATTNCTVTVGDGSDTFSVSTPVSLSAVAPATATKLLNDGFTGANGTTIAGRAATFDLIGSGWTIQANSTSAPGTATIQSNKASIAALTGIAAEMGTPNHLIDVDWTPTAAKENAGGIMLRYANASNFWKLSITRTASTICGGGTVVCNDITLTRVVGGVGTRMDFMDSTTTPALPLMTLGTTYRVMGVANGNDIAFGVLISGTWYVVKATDGSNNTNTKAGLMANGVQGNAAYAEQVYDDVNAIQTFRSTDPTTGRIADDPSGFFFGQTIPVGTFHWLAPRSQVSGSTPIDYQWYCCGSWYMDPQLNFVGNTTWGIERYDPTQNTFLATTHTHTTLDTGTPTAPTLNVVPNQSCNLNTDPGPLDLKTFISNSPQPAPTWDFTAGATGMVMTSGRQLDPNTGIITGICSSAAGSPVTTTIRATNATGNATRTFTQTVNALTDSVPDAFGFVPQTGVALNAAITSNTTTPTGYDTSTTVTVSGGTVSINGGGFVAGPTSIAPGQTIAVRQTSSASNNTTTTATVTIGGVSGVFQVTTLAPTPPPSDTVPDQFAFADAPGVAQNLLVASGQITVTGIDAASPISVTGGQYEKNNSGTWTNAAGTVVAGDLVRVRATSAATPNTAVNVVLTIGTVSDTFTITTALGSSCQNVPNQAVTVGQAVFIDLNAYCTGVSNFTGVMLTPGLSVSGSIISGVVTTASHAVEALQANGPQGSFPVRVTIDVGQVTASNNGFRALRQGLRH